MFAFLENIDPRFILLLAAGAIWVIGKVVAASQKIRQHTRTKIERQERRQTIEFEERTEHADPAPARTPRVEVQPPPLVKVAPVRRPPRKKKYAARRRVIQRTVREAQPQRPVGIRERLRDVRSLRHAIVLREILGPPKALRGRRMR